MKKIILTLALCLLASPVFANNTKCFNFEVVSAGADTYSPSETGTPMNEYMGPGFLHVNFSGGTCTNAQFQVSKM